MLSTAALGQANATLPASRCQLITFQGTVATGQVYRREIGGGLELVLRPEGLDFSGWELRIVPATSEEIYPDYAALATPPYQSVNPLLINTAYGMRAQDAAAWNPRTFQWIARPLQYRHATEAYFSYLEPRGPRSTMDSGNAMAALVRLPAESSTGVLRILDARLAPGQADQTAQAAGVTSAAIHEAHTLEPVGSGESPQAGGLHWLRFEVTLGVPENWRPASGLQGDRSKCGH